VFEKELLFIIGLYVRIGQRGLKDGGLPRGGC
jgi:hypothetical protein